MLVECRGGGGEGAVQTASRVEERPHKLYMPSNTTKTQYYNRLIMLFYGRPPPLELEYTISVEISNCNTLYFRFCIMNLRFYCKFYFIPVGLVPYIVHFTS